MAAPNFHNVADGDLPTLLEDGSPTRLFKGRLPDPTEVVRWGGLPGCNYAFVTDAKLGQYRRAGWVIAPGTDSLLLTVEGPKGSCDIFVIVSGKPIAGGDPANGIRYWHYDPQILERTGLVGPYPDPVAEAAKRGGRPHTTTIKAEAKPA
jgi:hypothetical protein